MKKILILLIVCLSFNLWFANEKSCTYEELNSWYFNISSPYYTKDELDIWFEVSYDSSEEINTLVHNWIESNKYLSIFWLKMSKDKTQYAFWWTTEEGYTYWQWVYDFVVNGKIIKGYDKIEDFLYYWDNKLIYVWKKDFKYYIIQDWKEVGVFEDFSSLEVSDNWVHFAYWVFDWDDWYVVDNYKKERTEWRPFFLTYSPVSSEYAYWVDIDWKTFVIKWWKKGKAYDRVSWLTYSDDWKSFLHSAKLNSQRFIVKDDKEYWNYDLLSDVQYRPWTHDFSYSYFEEWSLRLNYEWKLIEDYSSSHSPTYSPDWSRFVFIWSKWGDLHIIEAEEESRWYKVITPPRFSPNGKYLVYGAYWNSKNWSYYWEMIVINDNEIIWYDEVSLGEFSNDSKSFLFSWKKDNVSKIIERKCLLNGSDWYYNGIDIDTWYFDLIGEDKITSIRKFYHNKEGHEIAENYIIKARKQLYNYLWEDWKKYYDTRIEKLKKILPIIEQRINDIVASIQSESDLEEYKTMFIKYNILYGIISSLYTDSYFTTLYLKDKYNKESPEVIYFLDAVNDHYIKATYITKEDALIQITKKDPGLINILRGNNFLPESIEITTLEWYIGWLDEILKEYDFLFQE